jgi:hypothetical protein
VPTYPTSSVDVHCISPGVYVRNTSLVSEFFGRRRLANLQSASPMIHFQVAEGVSVVCATAILQ